MSKPMNTAANETAKGATAHTMAPVDPTFHGATHMQWLAGLAMHAFIMRMEHPPEADAAREEIALWSYRMAQAMKKMERHIRPDQPRGPSS